jgi:hypothetical protein
MVRANYPEPVQETSQLAVLPFVSAVTGAISLRASSGLRVTMHRLMAREGRGYIQQICTYFGSSSFDQTTVGRMWPVDTGVMGRALLRSKIQRTRRYPDVTTLEADLRSDLADNGENKTIESVAKSYLAIPFFSAKSGQSILTLYAESYTLNVFADDDLLEELLAMCIRFCELHDWLEATKPLNLLRNFPLEIEKFERAPPTVYRRLQEELDLPVPTFQKLASFNYDVSAG